MTRDCCWECTHRILMDWKDVSWLNFSTIAFPWVIKTESLLTISTHLEVCGLPPLAIHRQLRQCFDTRLPGHVNHTMCSFCNWCDFSLLSGWSTSSKTCGSTWNILNCIMYKMSQKLWWRTNKGRDYGLKKMCTLQVTFLFKFDNLKWLEIIMVFIWNQLGQLWLMQQRELHI